MTFARCLLLLTLASSSSLAASMEASAADFLRAIRANDLTTLKSLCQTSAAANTRDRLDSTPLHYAALYGSTESLGILLEAGADPNARNSSQATPLMYAAYSFEKTRLLVEKGAGVNAKASEGTTPLWVASAIPGNLRTVRYLIEKGADRAATRANGADYLIRAAFPQDASAVRYLLTQNLDPHRASADGDTALTNSISCDGGAKARLLIEAGSNVNAFNTDAGRVKNGPIEATGETPLMLAASCAEPSTVSALIEAGANLNAVDFRHMTALMRAAASDHANSETVNALVSAGADLNIADRNSETALDWARKFNNPAIVGALEKAGAKANGLAPAPVRPSDYKPTPREAIDRASALLAKSNEAFFKEGGGCIGCHHQPFAGRAFAAVKAAGLPAEPRLRQILIDGMVAERTRRINSLPLMNAGGGGYTSFLYPLAGMADMGEPASPFTDLMVHFIAEKQDPSGAWSASGSRPPLQESAITQTMLAIYALKTYGWPARGAEFHDRIDRARAWLRTASAISTVDEADRLMGLWLASTPAADLKAIARMLLSKQRPDGGWAQTTNLESDAFGTAAALYSLRRTGFLAASDAAYRRGADYLLNTQFPDGSWYVRSRVVKLQPYFQSAFPYNHDQWISNSATAYAVMALAPIAVK